MESDAKQYMQEHLPPNFPFIFGAPLGDNDSPIWMMLVKHYGIFPVKASHLNRTSLP
jgi:hypothetical protein